MLAFRLLIQLNRNSNNISCMQERSVNVLHRECEHVSRSQLHAFTHMYGFWVRLKNSHHMRGPHTARQKKVSSETLSSSPSSTCQCHLNCAVFVIHVCRRLGICEEAAQTSQHGEVRPKNQNSDVCSPVIHIIYAQYNYTYTKQFAVAQSNQT